MEMRKYDEPALLARLKSLDREAKTAFAVACAQRVLPLFERYAQSAGHPERAERLEAILTAVWGVTSGGPGDIRPLESEALSLVPPEDQDQDWVLESGYGENAAAAAAYAVRTWIKDDPQDAAWAARRLYDVADYAFWQANPTADFNEKGPEPAFQKSEIVQTALHAIDQDIEMVSSSQPSWHELRQRAEREGEIWVATFP
jgi:hypothetical protein